MLVVIVCLRIAVRRLPIELLLELWPGEPAALYRLMRLRPAPTAEAEMEAPGDRVLGPDVHSITDGSHSSTHCNAC